jgi:septal ring factor EnvC (AmiA/AmiB activator)
MSDRYGPDEFARNTDARASNEAGSNTKQGNSRASDLARLERGVRQLVERLHASQGEADELRRQLEANDTRVHDLEEELLASNQRRQDALKRIDDLAAWIDSVTEAAMPNYSVSEARPANS